MLDHRNFVIITEKYPQGTNKGSLFINEWLVFELARQKQFHLELVSFRVASLL